ncbi:hypothetical protein, partial [Salmonella sp. s54836]|uniref:hypothetical protein n=1 Tax=Salmonella sp. s54836 TaxID=3159673 RepID=UPI003981699B
KCEFTSTTCKTYIYPQNEFKTSNLAANNYASNGYVKFSKVMEKSGDWRIEYGASDSQISSALLHSRTATQDFYFDCLRVTAFKRKNGDISKAIKIIGNGYVYTNSSL